MNKSFGSKIIRAVFGVFILFLIYFLIEYMLFVARRNGLIGGLAIGGAFSSFIRIFLSIIMEGFPFILIGAIISSLIHVFVSEQTIKNLLPRRNILGIMVAGLLGIIFPVCECAIVPIVRRLIKKGMPIHIAITFMITVPIVNPIVMFSTYYAFSSVKIAIMRGVFGYIAACIIGMIILFMGERNPFKSKKAKIHHGKMKVIKKHSHGCGCSVCTSEVEHHNKGKLKIIIEHTNEELMTIGKFFIVGAFISSLFQVAISKGALSIMGENIVLSVFVMIVIAFMLSLCSEADAFIGRAFAENFSSGAVMAFLVFGPMIDLKNTLMLSGYFKKTFIVKLIFIIFSVVFVMGCLINAFGGLAI